MKPMTILCTALLMGGAFAGEEVSATNPPATMQEQADCSMLTPAEQDFSKKLNSQNMMMFCNKFNKSMRDQAMQMSKSMNNNPASMTPNQAVEKVAKEHNITMPATQKRVPSSSCPVK